MEKIINWIGTVSTGHWYIYAFPLCVLVLLLISDRERRIRFIYPSLIISVLIANPLFYQIWNKLGRYAYWRVLWIIPVIPVLAATVTAIAEKTKKWVKYIVVCVCLSFVILGGTFVYENEGGEFTAAGNAYKLPDAVVSLGETLLEMDDHPRVIANPEVCIYIRQYSGKIQTIYGRDIQGYITSPSILAQKVNKALQDGDMEYISQVMLDEGYDYFVYRGDPGECFEMVESTDEYFIFMPVGTPSLRKERNELGQVTGITTLDEDGLPANGENGYATLKQEYDPYGNVTGVQYLDPDGQPVATAAGYAEKRSRFDSRGRIIREEYYGADGNPCVLKEGYSAFRQTWNGQDPAERVYLGTDGEPVTRTDGYSRISWKKDKNGISVARYYDGQGNEISIDGLNLARDVQTGEDGWSMWMTPETKITNSYLYIGAVNLGEKSEGDRFICEFEVEFRGVKASGDGFLFRAQGTTDGTRAVNSPWNKIISLKKVPKDGVYSIRKECALTEKTAKAGDFYIGFRCDNWESGSFRVRNVSIRKLFSGEEN